MGRCQLWVAGLLLLGALSCTARPQQEPRSLLFISLDTTRQDHLSVYGYERPTTPTLERLARDAVVFWNAFSQDTNTNPSHASMFTALYPHRHGSPDNGYPLPADRRTLAEILSAAGFRCAAFVSGWTMVAWASGLGRGFERYDDRLGGIRRSGSETVSRALRWLRELPPRQRFFLFVHLYDAHGPYDPPQPYAELFRSETPGPTLRAVPEYQQRSDANGQVVRGLNAYLDRYDASLRLLDDLVSQLLSAVDLGRTVVVVVGDHGETLGERYWALDHGGQVFDEQIRIPLLLHVPGTRAGRVDGLVETVDLLPTVLEALALEDPEDPAWNGRSLLPLVADAEPPGRALVFSSAHAEANRFADRGYQIDPSRRLYTARSARWKLIRIPGLRQDYWELYDLEADPGERIDVAAQHPDRVRALQQALLDWLGDAAGARMEPLEFSDEERAKLRALGYLAD